MKQYKTVWNMGVAFDEDRAARKFSMLAKEGWILTEMKVFTYQFEKQQPQELIYSMDYSEIKNQTEEKEYTDIFKAAGWIKSCSYGQFHWFSAKPGTVPIYTEQESYESKYRQTRNSAIKALIISILLLVLTITTDRGNLFGDNSLLNGIGFLLGLVAVVIAVPSLMVTVALVARGRRRIGSLDK